MIASVFGDWVRELKYFWFKRADIEGIPLLIARSGWSKQGGFELYLLDGSKGTALWNLIDEAGRAWDIAAGYPNGVERVESGLISWGGDTDDSTNPFEIRLENYVDLDVGDEVVGIDALRTIKERGVARHQLGVILDDETPMKPHWTWYDIEVSGSKVGDMTNGVFSYRLKRNIGYALIARACQPGDRVEVVKDQQRIPATLSHLALCISACISAFSVDSAGNKKWSVGRW